MEGLRTELMEAVLRLGNGGLGGVKDTAKFELKLAKCTKLADFVPLITTVQVEPSAAVGVVVGVLVFCCCLSRFDHGQLLVCKLFFGRWEVFSGELSIVALVWFELWRGCCCCYISGEHVGEVIIDGPFRRACWRSFVRTISFFEHLPFRRACWRSFVRACSGLKR